MGHAFEAPRAPRTPKIDQDQLASVVAILPRHAGQVVESKVVELSSRQDTTRHPRGDRRISAIVSRRRWRRPATAGAQAQRNAVPVRLVSRGDFIAMPTRCGFTPGGT